ncbi:uncharacterized protein LOC135160427 [Diachasmimorpha longicaudata]|uniref:uncharacterized protein LOC135160427 n=1 Tax=Diachasmimorpha longicaudata TaxID=58733 RepID=UPI0030B8C6AA
MTSIKIGGVSSVTLEVDWNPDRNRHHWFKMANSYCLVVLAVLAMISMACCDVVTDVPCSRKPFQSFRLDCIAEDEIVPNGEQQEMDECIFRAAGVIQEDGEIDMPAFQNIVELDVIDNKYKYLTDYIVQQLLCLKKHIDGNSLKDSVRAWIYCEDKQQTKSLLERAVCEDDEIASH